MNQKPLVGILMGSESDKPVMEKAAKIFSEFGVPYEMRVISAHRLPDVVAEYAMTAESRGLEVLIAGAGMAAHLAGALAANTTLPIIGVPLASGALKGMDALLSIVQMPAGVPVASVAIGSAGAKNAAFLAAQMLALTDADLSERLRAERRANAESIAAKDRALQEKLGRGRA